MRVGVSRQLKVLQVKDSERNQEGEKGQRDARERVGIKAPAS